MTTPIWSPGTLYQPGDIVQRRSGLPVVVSAPDNPDFDDGTGWTFDPATWTIAPVAYTPTFNGPDALWFNDSFIGVSEALNDNIVPVHPGQTISATCYVNTTGQSHLGRTGAECLIVWYDADGYRIGDTWGVGLQIRRTSNSWQQSGVTAVAPSDAAFAQIGVGAFRSEDSWALWVDAFAWDYAYSAPPDGLVFKAVQADAGYSASTEPVWPDTVGVQVVDNQVTWEAVIASRVIWTASSILTSGATEPTWPTVVGGHVVDNTISWETVSRQITDPKCPQSVVVAIAASKVFAGDDDIISYSATINPLDWSTKDDAGYLPFGLQTYGSTPLTAIGLYRGNLVAFNSQGFQMWQVDQDPANMALLDSVPVSCTFPRTVQPFANDLMFLNVRGYRNVGIAGASTNLQANAVGEPIDSLVIAKIREGTYAPISLYWPAAGQYWGFFGDEAFVLTINGANQKSWSRYTFPAAITDWALHGTDLYLRAGDLVWVVEDQMVMDDTQDPVAVFTVGPPPPPAAEAISFAGVGYISIPPVDAVTSYTVTGWARLAPGSSGFLVPFSDARDSGFNTIYIDMLFGFNFNDPNTSGPAVESPANDTWFFFSIVNTPTDGIAKWCYLADTSFISDRTVVATGFGTPVSAAPEITTVGAYVDSAPAGIFDGDICQVRRWKAELSDMELIAEKDSATVVRTANLWSSNPFGGAADMSDESGNGRVGTPVGTLADVMDGPGN